MWSSEHTAVIAPVNIGDSYWSGEFTATHSPVHVDPSCARTAFIGSLSSGAGEPVDKILKERIVAEGEDHQRRRVQERGRTVGKQRAVFGAVRRLLSRSRSASKESSRSGRERSISLDYALAVASTTIGRVGNNTTYNSEPAPRRFFSSRPQPKASTTGREGCADRPRSDRLGREENFHLAMDNKLVHIAFAAFCKKTFAAENIEFVCQVREVDKLSTAEGTTASELRAKLRHVADQFVGPESATQVNVDGSSREGALCSIQAALEATSSGGSQGGGGGESTWAWVRAVEAAEALVELARELHTVIFDGLWPRFLTSDEFTVMMSTEEMRTVGFTDLDGKLIVSAPPPQHPEEEAGGKGSSTANKRQLSSRLASSFRAARLVTGGGGGGAGKDSAAVCSADGAGGAENMPPSKKTASSSSIRSVGSMSGLAIGSRSSSGGGGDGRSLDIVEAATVAAATAATTKAAVTPTARPPLGRRNRGRMAFSSSSRPPRTIHSNIDSTTSSGGGRRQVQHHVLGEFPARWAAAGRARRRDASGGGCGGASGRGGPGCAANRTGFMSSPVSPILIGRGISRSSPFASAAAEQRAFSLR